MSKKIPCGGFYLDDMLNVNDSGELSINGGTPYQQLVTDGNGNAKWEDRFRVVFKRGEDGNLIADKTFEEVFNADESGENVSGVLIMGERSYANLLMSNAVDDVSIVFVSVGIERDNVIVTNIVMSVDGITMVTKTLSATT